MTWAAVKIVNFKNTERRRCPENENRDAAVLRF